MNYWVSQDGCVFFDKQECQEYDNEYDNQEESC